MTITGTFHQEAVILEQGEAVVIYEPCGDHGLEGYSLGDTVKYSLCQNENAALKELTNYYRVQKLDWKDYYEICSPNAFKKYFTKT